MRNPQPTSLQKIKGFSNNRRKYEIEPVAPKERPICPDYLDDYAKAEWEKITTALDEMGILSSADSSLIEIYCVNYSKFRNANDQLNQYGDVIVTKEKALKLSPYFSVLNRSLQICNKILSELGLSPVARARMRQPAPKKETKLSKLMAI